MSTHPSNQIRLPSRRSFLQQSGSILAAGAAIGSLAVPRAVHAAGSDVLRVGLVGCGGRGTGAASQALQADQNVQLTAVGDVFADKIQSSLKNLRASHSEKVKVGDDQCFVGFDAYQKVIDSGVDVVLLCTPPHFRPVQIEAAVKAGKHIFAEKPVAVDAPGVRRVLAACEEAKQKKLSVVSGLCWRYDAAKREAVERIHNGDIGRVVAMQVSYNTGSLWMHPRKPEWSDMEWQLRNWLYFTWLSGDHNNEQHVHSLDKAAWVMNDEPPVRCIGIGGRQVRTGPEYGNIFDHHCVQYEYANGVRLFANCRQQQGCANDVSDTIMGTEGIATLLPKDTIEGKVSWRFRGPKANMYQVEHNELFAGIRSGQPRNDGRYMSLSSMLAIMGRMATYTGQFVTWDQAFYSTEDLTPAKYEWGPLEVAPVAVPGVTRLATADIPKSAQAN